MQLLYGGSGPDNNARFNLPEFNALYERARTLSDSPERTRLFDRMTELAIAYAPLRFTYHLLEDNVRHPWIGTYVPHPIRSQTWMFIDVDRRCARQEWRHSSAGFRRLALEAHRRLLAVSSGPSPFRAAPPGRSDSGFPIRSAPGRGSSAFRRASGRASASRSG
jgi:hypothetical protein